MHSPQSHGVSPTRWSGPGTGQDREQQHPLGVQGGEGMSAAAAALAALVRSRTALSRVGVAQETGPDDDVPSVHVHASHLYASCALPCVSGCVSSLCGHSPPLPHPTPSTHTQTHPSPPHPLCIPARQHETRSSHAASAHVTVTYRRPEASGVFNSAAQAVLPARHPLPPSTAESAAGPAAARDAPAAASTEVRPQEAPPAVASPPLVAPAPPAAAPGVAVHSVTVAVVRAADASHSTTVMPRADRVVPAAATAMPATAAATIAATAATEAGPVPPVSVATKPLTDVTLQTGGSLTAMTVERTETTMETSNVTVEARATVVALEAGTAVAPTPPAAQPTSPKGHPSHTAVDQSSAAPQGPAPVPLAAQSLADAEREIDFFVTPLPQLPPKHPRSAARLAHVTTAVEVDGGGGAWEPDDPGMRVLPARHEATDAAAPSLPPQSLGVAAEDASLAKTQDRWAATETSETRTVWTLTRTDALTVSSDSAGGGAGDFAAAAALRGAVDGSDPDPAEAPEADEVDLGVAVNEMSRPVTAASARHGVGVSHPYSEQGPDLVDAFAQAVLADIAETHLHRGAPDVDVDGGAEGWRQQVVQHAETTVETVTYTTFTQVEVTEEYVVETSEKSVLTGFVGRGRGRGSGSGSGNGSTTDSYDGDRNDGGNGPGDGDDDGSDDDDEGMDMGEVVNEVSRPVTVASSARGVGVPRMHSDRGLELVETLTEAVLAERARLAVAGADSASEGASAGAGGPSVSAGAGGGGEAAVSPRRPSLRRPSVADQSGVCFNAQWGRWRAAVWGGGASVVVVSGSQCLLLLAEPWLCADGRRSLSVRLCALWRQAHSAAWAPRTAGGP
jgi:hypothetical protein